MASHFKWFSYVLLAVFMWSLSAHTDEAKPVTFKKIDIEIGSKKIKVELAATPDQHQRGLMYREKLGADSGMLFVFDMEDQLSFWMKNTYVDLAIAYIDKNKKIVDIQEMQATSKVQIMEPKTYPSKKPAKYALEMNKGWFKKNNIKIGDKLVLPKNIK